MSENFTFFYVWILHTNENLLLRLVNNCIVQIIENSPRHYENFGGLGPLAWEEIDTEQTVFDAANTYPKDIPWSLINYGSFIYVQVFCLWLLF
jgi:hypothetical protein